MSITRTCMVSLIVIHLVIQIIKACSTDTSFGWGRNNRRSLLWSRLLSKGFTLYMKQIRRTHEKLLSGFLLPIVWIVFVLPEYLGLLRNNAISLFQYDLRIYLNLFKSLNYPANFLLPINYAENNAIFELWPFVCTVNRLTTVINYFKKCNTEYR